MAINFTDEFDIHLLDAADDITAGVRQMLSNLIDLVETCGGDKVKASQAVPQALVKVAAEYCMNELDGGVEYQVPLDMFATMAEICWLEEHANYETVEDQSQ